MLTQVGLIRCVFGNPFRLATIDPRWFTSTVVALADGIYHKHAFDRMPILADARSWTLVAMMTRSFAIAVAKNRTPEGAGWWTR